MKGKAINIGDMLGVRSRLEKIARIFTYTVILDTLLLLRTMRDNADIIIESVKSGTVVFV